MPPSQLLVRTVIIASAALLPHTELLAEDSWSNSGLLPESFSGHTATLLEGGKVLVAGGITPDGTGFGGVTTRSAVIFDPSVGSWTPTAPMLGLHTGHRASLLKDGRVLICGGFGEPFNPPSVNCEIFDPATETWSSAASLPFGITSHTATVLEDGRVLIVGGDDGSFAPQTRVLLYSPDSDTWSTTGSLAEPRLNHDATLLPDGKVLVSSGTGEFFVDLSTTEIFDPSTETWTSSGSMTIARPLSTTTLLQDGRVMVAGGLNSESFDFFDTTEIYDPTTGLWSPGPSLSAPRGTARASLLGDGRLMIVGGQGDNFMALSSTDIFDPALNGWSPGPPMSGQRSDSSATLLSDGRLLVIGGESADQFLGTSATAEIYGPPVPGWETTDPMPEAFNNHTSTVLEDGRLLIAGGFATTDDFGSAEFTGSAALFDPANDQWSTTGSMSSPRTEHTASLLQDGRVLVTGGFKEVFFSTQNTCELFDPSTGTWSMAASLPTALAEHTASVLTDGRVLVVGGSSPQSQLSSAFLYSPATDTWTSVAEMSVGRSAHAATLLQDGKVLVSGGIGNDLGQPFNSEVYDPATDSWSLAEAMTTNRLYHTPVVLSDGRVLVAGGAEFDFEAGIGVSTNSVEVFDPSTGMWTDAADMLTPRDGFELTTLKDGRIVAAGGAGGADGLTFLTSAEVYDPELDSWTAIPSLNLPRAYLIRLRTLNDGRVIFTGGTESNQTQGSQGTAEIFDPSILTAPTSTFAQFAAAAGLTGDNALADATPFSDGVPNILKFAFNMDLSGPDSRSLTTGGSSGLPRGGIITENGQTYWCVTYLRRKDSGLIYAPQKSISLQGFIPLVGEETAVPLEGDPDWELVTVKEPCDPATTPRCFSVVEVTEAIPSN